MKLYKKILILLNLLLLLVFFHISIAKKEDTLEQGTLVLLPLAPVDPRSLMQGDYMSLNYALAQGIDRDSVPDNGYCVVALDTIVVARLVRMQQETTPLHAGEYLIRYKWARWGQLNIGAGSFFFQEGQGQKYEAARYGAIRVDKKGNSILVGLYNAARQPIQ